VHVPLLVVLNVCVGAFAARALRTALAHGIHRVRSVLSSIVPCWYSGSTHASPFCLSHDCDFFRVPFRSRAPPPTSTPPSSPPPRAFRCHVTDQS